MAGEQHARFVSPARCAERPWDQWARELGRAAPAPDAAPGKRRARAPLLRLRRADMPLHGLLPREPVRAALCARCPAVLHPSAARQHLAAHDPPVVSIQDPEELPLGETLTDDIFAIMNSEGIQSADGIASATDWKNIIRDIGDLQELSFSQPPEPGPSPERAPAPAAPPPAARFASPEEPPPPRPAPRARSKPGRSKFSLREYDPNKHCGVATAEGKPCTRSLTCKAHALSLRRCVEGRAKPFDALLAEHRAGREAAAAPPAPLELPPLLAAAALDLGDFGGLATEQQVNDIYSLLSVDDPDSLLADPATITSLLSEPLPEPFLPEPAPAPPEPAERAAPERPERAREEAPAPLAGDVCWYAACPRPLAVCTFNASQAGGAIALGKKFATVRSNIKSSLSRSQCKSTGGTNNFYYGQSALSLSKSVHMNASKTNKPEVRRLIVCSGARDGQGVGELLGGARPLNGHVGPAAGKARAPLKHKHPAAPVLELGFSLDPLLADEKC